MARKGKKSAKEKPVRLRDRPRLFVRWVFRMIFRGFLIMVSLAALAIAAFSVFNPPTTPYMFSEGRRVGDVNQTWVSMHDIAPVMARSAVAAEDANFCRHWGLDVSAIRAALAEGGDRGGSTISQQMVKNVYLWHGRSWMRKSLEAVMTPLVEAVWSKERILEVYLNVAEFDEGVFGVEAAAVHYFGVHAADLTSVQAARLAAVLPDPKRRSAAEPSAALQRRAARIRDGAATIQADGRAACFQ